jgi:omega-6 fatty acid desaturase (delta-12 desaturase)
MRHDPTAPGPALAEVRGRIADDRRHKALGRGLASLLVPAAAWAATLAGLAVGPWWLLPPLGVLNGLALGVLFIVGHDAGHGTLFPRRWMNRLAGRLCLLPALHPFTAWVHNHNGLHHAFTNVKEKDPGFPPLSPDEYRALPGWRRWLYRRKRTWYGLGLLYFLDMWVKWEMFPTAERAPRNPRAFRLDRLLVTAFGVGWVGLLAAAGWADGGPVGAGWRVLAGFALPQFAWNWFIAFLILQQHTHPRVPWYSALDGPAPSYYQAQVRATPHVHFPAPYRWVMRHIMEHTAHHADPGIPLYELADAQTELEKAYRRDMVRVLWTPGGFLRMLRTCRLYDYATHRWVDYDGTPTTEPLLPPPGRVPVGPACAS